MTFAEKKRLAFGVEWIIAFVKLKNYSAVLMRPRMIADVDTDVSEIVDAILRPVLGPPCYDVDGSLDLAHQWDFIDGTLFFKSQDASALGAFVLTANDFVIENETILRAA